MRKKRNREVRPAEPPPENPTEDAGGFHAVTDWVMAVLLLGAAGLAVWYFQIAWNFDFDSPKFNPMVFVPIFLGAYGLYHLTLALRGTLLGRKFGLSTMHIEGGDVRMGATIRGLIRTEAELHPAADYEIRLQCIETFTMRRGSGDTNRNVDRVRWEAATRVAPAAVNSRQGIPFEFTLPQSFGEPATSGPGSVVASAVAAIGIPGLQGVFAHNRAPDAVRWIITIDAPLPGINYHALFGVVVKDSTRAGDTEIVVDL